MNVRCPTCKNEIGTNVPGRLTRDIDAALTTVRQEARAAAFKEMVATIAVLPPQGTMNYRRGYEEGVRDALRTLEAAANSVKDSEGEGEKS